MNATVVQAIFKRNFAGYFSSPIGYVFICAFVLLTGFAAFWPNDFFNANLATLDQLNALLPWIMLVFIPAITMGIWAEERRESTDELVLTLPCSDLDVVLGKYLAALAIFTVALAFSASNLIVLSFLGDPDWGLIFANYAGYWLVGAAMLAIGMVASFLSSSLTVAFILGLAFNAPLVFAAWADAIVPWDTAARFVKSLSIDAQFDDFGRGLMTLSGVVYFLSIVVVSLYLSMVLIGRRHWAGGPYARSMAAHFAVRSLCLIAAAIGANVVATRYDWRLDASQERINSLSPQTLAMLRNLDTSRPVYIEAYVSPRVPEQFVQTRLTLLAMLREVDQKAGDKVVVRINPTERFSQVEAEAERQFNIRPMPVPASSGGRLGMEEIVLGAAFTCGLDKVVVPFFDRGIPAEYEVIRSIATVVQQQRKRIGVVMTDAKLFGGFEIETMSSRPDQLIIEELRKQFDVVQVNANAPITERYDAMLAVQPSSLTPQQLDNLIAAINSGQPTAVFEDPFPYLDSSVPATSQPRQPPRRNPFMQQPPPQPKGDINKLWTALGVRFKDREVIWQDYNPLPKIAQLPKEFVFITRSVPAAPQPFNDEAEITSGLQQLLALFPGAFEPLPGAATRFEPLVQTGKQTGVVSYLDILQQSFLGASLNPNRRHRTTNEIFTLAAHITGSGPALPTPGGDEAASAQAGINVVVVSDIDMLYSVFFQLRNRGQDREDPVDIVLDNVAFTLNVLDYLAGDQRFLDIRKRRPAYRTLTAVEKHTEQARAKANQERERFIQQFEAKRAEEQAKLDAMVKELQQREGLDPLGKAQEVATLQRTGQDRLQSALERFEKQRDQQLATIERDLALEVRRVQNNYKLAAIAFPPILPLLLGAAVFQRRRSMERIGVPKARMRK